MFNWMEAVLVPEPFVQTKLSKTMPGVSVGIEMGPPLVGANGGGPTPVEGFQAAAILPGTGCEVPELVKAEQEPMGVFDIAQVKSGRGPFWSTVIGKVPPLGVLFKKRVTSGKAAEAQFG